MKRRRTGKVPRGKPGSKSVGQDHVTRRKQSLDMRAILVQGDSVRMTWGVEEPSGAPPRPLRRDGPSPVRPAPAPPSEDTLRIRIGEELDYARRLLDATGDQLSNDPILIRRHAVALQSLDRVAQILVHLGNVVRSSDPHSAVEAIGMSDLKARLTRSRAL